MASRRFTVDLAKKKKFVDIFLLLPETHVTDAMTSAKFTEEGITNLSMRRFLQRALPGGSIQGLKAYVAGLLLPQPRHNQRPTRLVDDAIVNNVEANIVHVEDSSTPSPSIPSSTSSQGHRQCCQQLKPRLNARFVICYTTKTKRREFILYHPLLSRQLPIQRRQQQRPQQWRWRQLQRWLPGRMVEMVQLVRQGE
jgi:hypothetical protein